MAGMVGGGGFITTHHGHADDPGADAVHHDRDGRLLAHALPGFGRRLAAALSRATSTRMARRRGRCGPTWSSTCSCWPSLRPTRPATSSSSRCPTAATSSSTSSTSMPAGSTASTTAMSRGRGGRRPAPRRRRDLRLRQRDVHGRRREGLEPEGAVGRHDRGRADHPGLLLPPLRPGRRQVPGAHAGGSRHQASPTSPYARRACCPI